jgi:hypothetical protein
LLLSSYLSRPCVALVDKNLGCVRILACPEYRGIGDVFGHILGKEIHIESPRAYEDHVEKQDEKDDRQNENKVKVPRPPNAFILYRKHHHTILKEKNPAIHNNQICEKFGPFRWIHANHIQLSPWEISGTMSLLK